MRKLKIIGIGAGNPEHVTVQAIKALNQVDVFFILNKGDAKEDLVRLRRDICERYIDGTSYRIVEVNDPVRDSAISSYVTRVETWHDQRAAICEELIEKELREDECGAFLVWGDPSLYDSTLRVIDKVLTRNKILFDYEVIPGISSIQALAASHKISLNGIGESISITTGRRLSKGSFEGAENVVVMLDGDCSFKKVVDKSTEIFWGAYLGTDKEIILSGSLGETLERIETARTEARTRNGWIMDTYLLRKQTT